MSDERRARGVGSKRDRRERDKYGENNIKRRRIMERG